MNQPFLALLSHFANRGADVDSLKSLPAVPGVSAAETFYRRQDGVLLFTGRATGEEGFGTDEGIEIFPIAEWAQRTAQMVESWTDEGFVDAEMPYGKTDFIAIAHARGASSYIHWVTRGPRAGSIYWWPWTTPPGPQTPPIAASFRTFVDLICNDPVLALNEQFGGYTRFSDGALTNEWIPARYVPGAT